MEHDENPSVEAIRSGWEKIFSGCEEEITDIQENYPKKKSLHVDYKIILEGRSEIATFLLMQPDKVIEIGEGILRKTPKQHIHLRVINLPEEARKNISALSAEHIGKLAAIKGRVKKVGQVRPRILEATFQCTSCGAIIKMPQDSITLKEPSECYKEQEGCGKSSSSTKFSLLTNREHVFVDTQDVEIEEHFESVEGEIKPEALCARLEDDLVRKLVFGEVVILNGILRTNQEKKISKKFLLRDFLLVATSIETWQGRC